MVWLACALGALAVVFLIGWVATPLLSRRRLLRSHLRERFTVTLSTGETFNGLLTDHDAEHLVLEDANAFTAGRWTPAEGKVFLPRARVAYLQHANPPAVGESA